MIVGVCARKQFFHNTPFQLDDYFYVAIVVPVVHYCMAGAVR